MSVSNFNKLVKALEATNLPVTVKLESDGDMNIECGFDYPDSFFTEVITIVDSLELNSEVAICAEMSSSMTIEKTRINGGFRNDWEREY